jgi:hypothetical protein
MTESERAKSLQRFIGSTRTFLLVGLAGIALGQLIRIWVPSPLSLLPVSLCVGAVVATVSAAVVIWRPKWTNVIVYQLLIAPAWVLPAAYGSEKPLIFWLCLLPTVMGGLFLPLALVFAVFQRSMQRAVDRYVKKLSRPTQTGTEVHR